MLINLKLNIMTDDQIKNQVEELVKVICQYTQAEQVQLFCALRTELLSVREQDLKTLYINAEDIKTQIESHRAGSEKIIAAL